MHTRCLLKWSALEVVRIFTVIIIIIDLFLRNTDCWVTLPTMHKHYAENKIGHLAPLKLHPTHFESAIKVYLD